MSLLAKMRSSKYMVWSGGSCLRVQTGGGDKRVGTGLIMAKGLGLAGLLDSHGTHSSAGPI